MGGRLRCHGLLALGTASRAGAPAAISPSASFLCRFNRINSIWLRDGWFGRYFRCGRDCWYCGFFHNGFDDWFRYGR